MIETAKLPFTLDTSMPDSSNPKKSKSEEILSVAQDLVQTKGYNGFSYRDIAAAIGIKSASIHYHFPTKGDLGRDVTARYSDAFAQALQALLESTDSTHERIEGYAALFRTTLVEQNRLCMCGVLAGEVETVPDDVKVEVARFFEAQTLWLESVLQAGIDNGEILSCKDTKTWAVTILSSLEGGMLVARGSGDSKHFDLVKENLLKVLFEATPQ